MVELRLDLGRSPCRERGLKLLYTRDAGHEKASLPVQGAWIEILCMCDKYQNIKSRSPCRERGLKYFFPSVPPGRTRSLPVQGAWIEIPYGCCPPGVCVSLPVQGAWIEIIANA